MVEDLTLSYVHSRLWIDYVRVDRWYSLSTLLFIQIHLNIRARLMCSVVSPMSSLIKIVKREGPVHKEKFCC